MKWNRRAGFIFLLLSLWLLASCSQKPPATRQDREKWDKDSLSGAYNTGGNRDPKWDKDARQALDAYAQTWTAPYDEQETLSYIIGAAAEKATGEGCQDPMIGDLYVRYSPEVQGKPLADRQKLNQDAADRLEGSSYPAINKFYANLNTAEILWWGHDHSLWAQVTRHRRAAVSDLVQAVRDKTLPEADADAAARQLFDMLQYNEGETTNAYKQIDAALASQSGAMRDFIKASFYLRYAWQARGHGTAEQVTPEAWRLFAERLKVAHKALEHAWSHDPQDPQIPTLMISVVLGEQSGRPEMEKWFSRAMEADPDNYAACSAKLHYLLPEWYGSPDDMLAFGRECVASTNWGGQVPLTLVDAHRAIRGTLSGEDRRGYWLSPDVWPDIQSAYEKYALVNPNKTRFRYPYAWYAYACDQTNAFVQQIKLIRQNDDQIDYGYFGGKAAFDKAWADATGEEGSTNATTANTP
ncbi:MAG TPA: hypothetical protein VH280_01285 [Verrucomicrobiae bacterium]|jgi:hypothetical protein|nr:hypothetical protein [Verrucomicrobiae bacterium]